MKQYNCLTIQVSLGVLLSILCFSGIFLEKNSLEKTIPLFKLLPTYRRILSLQLSRQGYGKWFVITWGNIFLWWFPISILAELQFQDNVNCLSGFVEPCVDEWTLFTRSTSILLKWEYSSESWRKKCKWNVPTVSWRNHLNQQFRHQKVGD